MGLRRRQQEDIGTASLRQQEASSHRRPASSFGFSKPIVLILPSLLVLGLFWNWKLSRPITDDYSWSRSITSVVVPSSRNAQNHGKAIDILSVASKTRIEYVKTQRETWANHSLVRNFFQVTEDDDAEPNCSEQLTISQVLEISKFCRKRYLVKDTDPNFSWLMQRFVQVYAKDKWLLEKENPAGWLCAQRRFPLGVAQTILGYSKRNETLPDYLLVVDDDTYYNINLLDQEILKSRHPSERFVGAGCRIFHGHSMNKGAVFYFGGFGLILSKGSLERLLTPIYISQPSPETTVWQIRTLEALQKNLIFEEKSFRDGMNLAELMERLAMEEQYTDFSNWTRGYCFHGDMLMAIFTQLYSLHSRAFLDALQGSEIIQTPTKVTGICRNERGHCNVSALACHYQSPADMQRIDEAVKHAG